MTEAITGGEAAVTTYLDRRDLRRTILGASAGHLVEQYDSGLYAVTASLAFGTLFFTKLDASAALVASFSTYAVGFVARPLGGAVVSHFGDLRGRKNVFVAILMVAGISTTLIGALPTATAIGIWAPILLVILRFIQGLSLGAEYGGAALMVYENAPRRRRAFYTSFVPLAGALGIVIATVALLGVAALPEQQMLSWGWRLPFLFAFVLVLIGVAIRMRLHEPVDFTEDVVHGQRAKVPFLEALRETPRQFLAIMIACVGLGAVYYLVVTWGMGYLTVTLGLPSRVGLIGLLISQVVYIAIIPFVGVAADKFGRRSLYMVGGLLISVYAFPFISMLNTRSAPIIWLAITAAMVIMSLLFTSISTFICEQFPTKHRFSGASTSYTIGITIGGGFAPLIAASLVAATKQSWPIGLMIIIGGLLCAGGVLLVRDRLSADGGFQPDARSHVVDPRVSRAVRMKERAGE